MAHPSPIASHAQVARDVAAAFAALPQVVAVAMAGSRATNATDDVSDVDLYVYAQEPLSLAERGAVAARFATEREVGNAFWESGDEWIDASSGFHVDVMHRSPAWIEGQLDRILVRHEASVGCSTCFWHNVMHSIPLDDRSGWYRGLQTAADRPYPETLKRAIVAKNLPILRCSLSSYTAQIARAVQRGDSVSVQHRVTAILASYFDILFAVNELPHPGEKRLLGWARTRCPLTPPTMEGDIHALLSISAYLAPSAILGAIDALVDGLDLLVVDAGMSEALGSCRGR